MVEEVEDFIGDYQARFRVFGIFRGKSNLLYFEWNNKKVKHYVKEQSI